MATSASNQTWDTLGAAVADPSEPPASCCASPAPLLSAPLRCMHKVAANIARCSRTEALVLSASPAAGLAPSGRCRAEGCVCHPLNRLFWQATRFLLLPRAAPVCSHPPPPRHTHPEATAPALRRMRTTCCARRAWSLSSCYGRSPGTLCTSSGPGRWDLAACSCFGPRVALQDGLHPLLGRCSRCRTEYGSGRPARVPRGRPARVLRGGPVSSLTGRLLPAPAGALRLRTPWPRASCACVVQGGGGRARAPLPSRAALPLLRAS